MNKIQFLEKVSHIGTQHREYVHACWQQRLFPVDLWSDLDKAGFFSLLLKENLGLYDGISLFAQGLKALTYQTFDGGFPISMICHGALATTTLDKSTNPEHKKILHHLVKEQGIAAFAITEAHGGSDALRPQCSLNERKDGSYVLNGSKWHITNAPIATKIIAFVKHERTKHLTVVAVDSQRTGVKLSEPLKPVGTKTSLVGEIHFSDYILKKEEILYSGKEAYLCLERAFLIERLLTAWCVIGGLERCIEICLNFSMQRKVSGKAIYQYQYIQKRIVKMQIALTTLTALAEKTLQQFSLKKDISIEASILKMGAAQRAIECAIDAMKIGGTYHIQEELPFGRSLLDSLMVTIGGGTEEMHYNTIFRDMLKKHKRNYQNNQIIN